MCSHTSITNILSNLDWSGKHAYRQALLLCSSFKGLFPFFSINPKICSFREAVREVVYGRGASATTMTNSDVLGYLTKADNLSLLVIRNAGMAVPLE